MATNTDGTLTRIYRNRVGRPTTHDEVRGYWVFLTGLVLGTLGIVLFLPSTSAAGASGFTLREASIFFAAVGLAMLVAGPLIRLPLQSWANYAAYLGQAICFVAAVWFLLVFPAEWSVQTGSQPVILLYSVGLATLMIGGAIVPLVAGVTRGGLEASEGRVARLEAEVADLEAELDAERDRFESELDAARSETAAGEADRAALQATIDSVRTSQARFELYEDRAGQWRWRLRHRDGDILMDGGQGYADRSGARDGIESVKRNAPGAEAEMETES
jgi:uncharacterized protein YegP (UPF0339 family)